MPSALTKLICAGSSRLVCLAAAISASSRAVFLTDSAQFRIRGIHAIRGPPGRTIPLSSLRLRERLQIRVNQQEAAAGYHGDIWLDAETLDRLRLQLKADDIPTLMKLELVDNAINYAGTQIGGGDSLLPQTSVVVMRDLAGNENRNRTSFGQCRQSNGASVLSFGDANLAAAK